MGGNVPYGFILEPEKGLVVHEEEALGKATTKYSQNTLDATNAFELYVGEDRLAGLPDRAKQAARKAAESGIR